MLQLARAGWLVLLLALVAAWGTHAHLSRWGLREHNAAFSVDATIAGTAHKPFVYRQLSARVIDALEDRLPARWLEMVTARSAAVRWGYTERPGAAPPLDEARARRFAAVTLFVFVSALAAIVSAWALVRPLMADGRSALLAAAGYGLVMPMWLAVGGFVYDYAEWAFLNAFLALVARGRDAAAIALLPLAALNKETALLFVPIAWPLVSARPGRAGGFGPALRFALAGLAAAVPVVVATMGLFRDAPGNFSFWLPAALHEYAMRWTWTRFEPLGEPALPFPYGMNIGWWALVLVPAVAGARQLPPPWRRAFGIALAIQLPLFVLFCFPGEIRNLSLLFPFLMAAVAVALGGLGRQA